MEFNLSDCHLNVPLNLLRSLSDCVIAQSTRIIFHGIKHLANSIEYPLNKFEAFLADQLAEI